MLPLSLPQFMVLWLPAFAVSATVAEDAPARDPLVLYLGGVDVPIVTVALGALGILAARPLARQKEAEHGLGQFLLVSAILLAAVELWIVQTQPGWLFAFVVAIGLGFSGYSLIELLGEQIRELVKAGFDSAKGAIGKLTETKSDD